MTGGNRKRERPARDRSESVDKEVTESPQKRLQRVVGVKYPHDGKKELMYCVEFEDEAGRTWLPESQLAGQKDKVNSFFSTVPSTSNAEEVEKAEKPSTSAVEPEQPAAKKSGQADAGALARKIKHSATKKSGQADAGALAKKIEKVEEKKGSRSATKSKKEKQTRKISAKIAKIKKSVKRGPANTKKPKINVDKASKRRGGKAVK